MSAIANHVWAKYFLTCFCTFAIEIQVRPKERRSNEDPLVIYSFASYPSSIKVFPWYSLLCHSHSHLPSLSQPYMLVHKLKSGKQETISSIYHKYSHWSNLKLLLIVAPNIVQKQLDRDKELKDCQITIVIIPRRHKDKLFHFIKDQTRHYEVTVKPLLSGPGTLGETID